MQTKQLRVRIEPAETERVEKLAKEFRLPATTLVAMMIRASLEALEQNDDQFRMPLTFQIIEPYKPEGRLELNEPKPQKKK